MTLNSIKHCTSYPERQLGAQSRSPTSGAARQARYRAARRLRSVDIPAETLERMAQLCTQTGLRTQVLLAQALDCLEKRLRQEPSKSGPTRRRRVATGGSPVTLDLFGQGAP